MERSGPRVGSTRHWAKQFGRGNRHVRKRRLELPRLHVALRRILSDPPTTAVTRGEWSGCSIAYHKLYWLDCIIYSSRVMPPCNSPIAFSCASLDAADDRPERPTRRYELSSAYLLNPAEVSGHHRDVRGEGPVPLMVPVGRRGRGGQISYLNDCCTHGGTLRRHARPLSPFLSERIQDEALDWVPERRDVVEGCPLLRAVC